MNNDDNASRQQLIRLLSDYFSQRGTFLAQVIRADFQSLPLRLTTQNGASNSKTQVLATSQKASSEGNNIATQTVPAASITNSLENRRQETPTVNYQPAIDINSILLDLVVKQTGFPRESITLEARLLDELNLDSIKGGELVAAIAKECGVAGKVDPSTLANASLQEISDAIRSAMPTEHETSKEEKLVPTSLEPISTQKLIPWVRNFIVEYIPETALVTAEQKWDNANLFETDHWKTANVLIISEPEEADLVEALGNEFHSRGAKVQAATFVEVRERSLIESVDFSHFITILPRNPRGEMSSEARVQRAMERVRTVATLPLASQAQPQYTTVAYIQFGSGYFGKRPKGTDLEQCCTMAFASSLHLERPALKIRVIDFPPSVAPISLAELTIKELSQRAAYMAVGYDSQLTRLMPRPRVQDRTRYQSRNLTWLPKDVLLVTGGAKGITAECAFALARTTGVRMALVGTSPHPQDTSAGSRSAEIARTLQRYRDEKLTCQYYQCNVTDAQAVATLVERVERELGKITGVIHGAALNKPQRVENVTLEQAFGEVKVKVLGMMNLIQVLQGQPLKLLVGFSSSIGITGLPGNTWYGFANEVLDLIVRRFGEEHPETAVVAPAFSVWAEIGMGAKMNTVTNLARMGIEAIPTDEGVSRFLELIEKDPGDSQIVIAAKLGDLNTLQRGLDIWRPKRLVLSATSRFLEQVQNMEPGVEIVVRTHLTLERDSYVQDHIYNGSYLFPTVFGLEAMAQGVAYVTNRQHFSSLRIEDISLERPIVVDPEKGIEIEIYAEVLERESEKDPQQVRAEIRTKQTEFNTAHFAATFIIEGESDTSFEQIKLPEVPLNIDPKQDLYSWLLFQGPRFQRLQQIYALNSKKCIFSTQRGLPVAEDTDQSFDRASGPFLLGDPYYRDSLLQAVQPTVPQDICLPISIESIQIDRPNENVAGVYLGVAIIERREGRRYHTTVLTVAEDGRVIERLEDYQLQIIEHREDNPTAEELVTLTQPEE